MDRGPRRRRRQAIGPDDQRRAVTTMRDEAGDADDVRKQPTRRG